MWSFDAATSLNWLEVIKTLVAIITAAIAFFALRNWQRQDKAKRQADFLDALIEATHTYIAEVPKPITLLQIAKIGMASHVPTWDSDDDADRDVKGTIAYIEKNGERDAKRLLELLEAVEPSAIKLRALAAKGQVFSFDGYAKCQNAVTSLTWHLERIQAFAVTIASTTWNWENPEVLRLLHDVMAIDPSEIRESVQKNHVAVLKFATDTYQRIYR
ncbi:hypothetical protein [Paraburkholderia azotifigens]|uniref:HEAT repeat domain-containing protein n=1 Tax=Paraburkholderia azotifigens TaxID=2057004 RepID=A0ABU9R3N7_9BURK